MEPTINPHNELMPPVKRNTPRDVFLHLFAMVALYWSAISFITLCWQYINYFFPDPLLVRYAGQAYVGPIRFAVASLIIIFPLYILASWYLNKVYRREILVRDSKIRKWLIYLTLFIAALVIMGDLVTVIYSFLGGEITIRFVLKALSVLVVTGAIFGYYLDDVRRPQPSMVGKHLAIISMLVMLGMIIGAFFIVGSPQDAYKSQLDQQRISDLQGIQYQIVNYWQRKEMLPNTLADLNDPIAGYAIPSDPVTHQPYAYAITGASALAFQLCATFDLASDNNTQTQPMYPGAYSENWNHLAGYHCFDRAIDQQLYPPLLKGK